MTVDRNGMSDPLVVSTKALANAIQLWADSQDYAENEFDRRRHHMLSLSHYLSEESGVNKRRIWGILHTDTQTTVLGIADALLVAIGRPDLMPRIVPNPRWNQERWQSYMADRGCIGEWEG